MNDSLHAPTSQVEKNRIVASRLQNWLLSYCDIDSGDVRTRLISYKTLSISRCDIWFVR